MTKEAKQATVWESEYLRHCQHCQPYSPGLESKTTRGGGREELIANLDKSTMKQGIDRALPCVRTNSSAFSDNYCQCHYFTPRYHWPPSSPRTVSYQGLHELPINNSTPDQRCASANRSQTLGRLPVVRHGCGVAG
jgi:hypothetical protein